MARVSFNDLKNNFNKSGKSESKVDYSIFFDFWKMDEGQTVVVRFIEDADENNPLGFIVEDKYHKDENGRQVPCLGEGCPQCAEANKYFKLEKDNPDQAEEYHSKAMDHYRKVQYLACVKIIDAAGVPYDETRELHMLKISTKLFESIKAGFMSGDLEAEPYHIEKGHNFRIRKTKDGKWPSYATSAFAPKSSILPNAKALLKQALYLKEYKIK